VCVALANIVLAQVLGYDPTTRDIVNLLSLGLVLTSLTNVVTGTLQGLQRMKSIATISVLNKLGHAVIASALLVLGNGAIGVAASWVLVAALGLAYGTFVLFRRISWKASINLVSWRPLVLAGLPFFVWQAALFVYGQIDTVLLAFLTQDAVVGWYAVAYRIVMIPVFFPTIVITVIFPALSAATNHPISFASIARRGVHVIALVSTPMALGIMLLPDKIIHLFGYPVNFDNSIIPLMLLAPHLPLAAIDTMIGTVLNARDLQRQWALTGVAAAFLNPLLNLFAIPYAQSTWGNGAIGAAAITTLTEVFMLVGGLRLLPRGVFSMSTVTDVARCLAACLAMAAAVVLSRDLPLVVPIVVGGLVYSAAALAFGAVSVGDLKQLHVQLLRRTPVSPALPMA
jgi:O-antigen/teichoic acid export membrane protein